MSRGMGKCQLAILKKLEDGPFYLVDLLPDTYNLNEYKALHRAASILHNTGKISIVTYFVGSKKLLVQRFGDDKPVKRPSYKTTNKRVIKSRHGGKFTTMSTLKQAVTA